MKKFLFIIKLLVLAVKDWVQHCASQRILGYIILGTIDYDVCSDICKCLCFFLFL